MPVCGIREQAGLGRARAPSWTPWRIDGFVILGGQLDDGQHALLMVEAADEEEVAARMGQDPWAALGLLRIGALERWSIWLDSRPSRTRGR